MTSSLPPVDITAGWCLLYHCKLGCSYCPLPLELRKEKPTIAASPEQFKEAFKRTGRVWHLLVSGGEPLLYPRLPYLLSLLQEDHFVSLETSLCHNIRPLIDCLDPERVPFVLCSLHPERRLTHSSIQIFAQRFLSLQDAGLRALASAVMTPSVIDVFELYLRPELQKYGIVLAPKVLTGVYKGSNYPSAYSARHVDSLLQMQTRAQKMLEHVWPESDPHLLNIFRGYQIYSKEYSGLTCSAGQDYVEIQPDGTVNRCTHDGLVLGNILDESDPFTLLPAPLPCTESFYCRYICDVFAFH